MAAPRCEWTTPHRRASTHAAKYALTLLASHFIDPVPEILAHVCGRHLAFYVSNMADRGHPVVVSVAAK